MNNDDNRIRRKKVNLNNCNNKPKQSQRYYNERLKLENISYDDKVENNKIKRANTKRRKKNNKKSYLKLMKVFLVLILY